MASTFSRLISTFPDTSNNILIIRSYATRARLSHRQNTWSKSLFSVFAACVCVCASECAYIFSLLFASIRQLASTTGILIYLFFTPDLDTVLVARSYHKYVAVWCDFTYLILQMQWINMFGFICAIETDSRAVFV